MSLNASDDVPDTTKTCLVVWSILTAILSLVGNTTVLVASMKYKAIKFDKVSVILIENIAAADLGETVFVVIPTIWAILADQHQVERFFNHDRFGKLLCITTQHLQFWFPLAASVMICALNISKLTCLLSPLRAHTRSAHCGYWVAVFAWSIYVIRVIAVQVLHEKAMYRRWEEGFRCSLDNVGGQLLVDIIFGIVTVGLPGVIITFTVSSLLYFVHRSVGLQRQSVIVTILISIAFAVCYTPYIGWLLWNGIGVSDQDQPLSNHLWFVVLYINYILCFANPPIYYLSSASFKEFVNSSCQARYLAARRFVRRFYLGEIGSEDGQEPLLATQRLTHQ